MRKGVTAAKSPYSCCTSSSNSVRLFSKSSPNVSSKTLGVSPLLFSLFSPFFFSCCRSGPSSIVSEELLASSSHQTIVIYSPALKMLCFPLSALEQYSSVSLTLLTVCRTFTAKPYLEKKKHAGVISHFVCHKVCRNSICRLLSCFISHKCNKKIYDYFGN